MIRTLAWIALLAVLVALALARTGEEGPLDTDVTHLLPEEHQDPLVAEAMSRNRLGVSDELLVLVRGPDPAAREAAEAVAGILQSEGGVRTPVREDTEQLAELLEDYRFGLLADDRREAMRLAPSASYLDAVRARLARPAPGIGLSIDRDPAGLFADYLTTLPAPYPGFRESGDLWQREAQGETLWLFPGQLEGNAFAEATQIRVTEALERAREVAAERCPDCLVQATGPVRFASEQRDRARLEVLILSSLSLTGILALILFAFRSPRPLAMGVLALGSGVTLAVAFSLLVFGRLNVITLVAGTTLLGISIDYVFKYLVHRSESDDGHRVVRGLLRPLSLGVASSLLALGVLMASPFPALRELAVYAAAGLAGAWLTVVLLFPSLDRHRPARLGEGIQKLLGEIPPVTGGPRRLIPVIPLLCIPIGVLAFVQLPGTDDVRSFQSPVEALLSEDEAVRSATGMAFPEGFFLVRADDADEVLEREAALIDVLDQQSGHRRSVGTTRLIPPVSQQREAHQLVGEALHDPDLIDALKALGLGAESQQRLREDWAAGQDLTLRPEVLADTALADFLNAVWLTVDGRPASLVVPRGPVPETLVSDAGEGVSFIRPVEAMNQTLSEQRAHASTWILLAAALGIPALFMLMLGPRRGMKAALAPLSALSLTLIFLWVSGIGINTFVLMGLVLGLGIGADYAAFLASERGTARAGITGIGLAGLTTLLAFGLLGLSRIPALQEFGLTAAVGIVTAWLCAFIIARPPPGQEMRA